YHVSIFYKVFSFDSYQFWITWPRTNKVHSIFLNHFFFLAIIIEKYLSLFSFLLLAISINFCFFTDSAFVDTSWAIKTSDSAGKLEFIKISITLLKYLPSFKNTNVSQHSAAVFSLSRL